jgi:hypothetical protein
MMMSDRKPISDLTPNELRQEIAERLFPDCKVEAIEITHNFGDWVDIVVWDTDKGTRLIPNWPTDLNAAARDLLTQVDCAGLGWDAMKKRWDATFPYWGIDKEIDSLGFEAQHANPATAICLAWLQMQREAEK